MHKQQPLFKNLKKYLHLFARVWWHSLDSSSFKQTKCCQLMPKPSPQFSLKYSKKDAGLLTANWLSIMETPCGFQPGNPKLTMPSKMLCQQGISFSLNSYLHTYKNVFFSTLHNSILRFYKSECVRRYLEPVLHEVNFAEDFILSGHYISCL